MIFLSLILVEILILSGLNFPGVLGALPESLHDAFRRHYIRRDMNTVTLSEDCGRYDPELFYTLKPGTCRFANREFDVEFAVNSAGLRDDEASLNAPDVILLGDSEAQAWALNADLSFANRLERSTGLTVLNAAMASFGTARAAILLRRLDRSGLKALVVQYNANDIEENSRFEPGRGLKTRSADEYREWQRANEKRRRYVPLRATYYFLKDNLRRWKNLSDVPMTSLEQEIAAFLPPFTEIASLAPGIPVFLFEMGGGNLHRKGFAEAVAARLKETAPALADRVVPVALADGFSQEMIFDLDWHFNAKGHAVVAERLKAAMDARGITAGQ